VAAEFYIRHQVTHHTAVYFRRYLQAPQKYHIKLLLLLLLFGGIADNDSAYCAQTLL